MYVNIMVLYYFGLFCYFLINVYIYFFTDEKGKKEAIYHPLWAALIYYTVKDIT